MNFIEPNNIFSFAFRHVDSCVISLTLNYEIMMLNSVAERYYRWKEKEVVGKNYISLCKRDGFEPVLPENGSQFFQGKLISNCANKITHQDGKISHGLWTVSCIFDSDQAPQSFILIGNDIKTDQNPIELCQLTNVTEQIPGVVYWKDIEGKYLGGNYRLLQERQLQSLAEVIGKTDTELCGGKDSSEIRGHDLEVMKQGQMMIFEENLITPHGTPLTIISAKAPLRDSAGNIVGIIANSIDVTNLKNAELQAQKEKMTIISYLNNIVACTPGSIYWKDKKGRYLGCNDYMLKESGLHSIENLIGKTDYELWPDKNQADLLRKTDEEVMKQGSTIRTLEIVVLPNGDKKYFAVVKMPLRDAKGNIDGIVGNSLEITELKNAEEQLQKAKEQAEAAILAKNQFITNMEHDLRTPCAGISGMCRLFEAEETDQEKKKTFHYMANAAYQLLTVLNEILTFDQITSKGLPIVEKNFEIRTLIENVIALEKPAAELKHLNLFFICDDDVPQVLSGDDVRISRILINLVSNAIKFTFQGYVKVKVELAKRYENKTAVINLIVEDTGVGIPKDKQNFIYERISQNNISNEAYKGSGLGLKIVKQFMYDLQGEINLETIMNQGTKFACMLPLKIPLLERMSEENIATEDQVIANRVYSNIRVLIVEDGVLAQIVAKSLLQDKLQCQLDIADTGEKALQLAKNNRYDIIFMDTNLDDTNGFEVTQQIREYEEQQALNKTPIIALTAHSMEETKQMALQSGMDDFLVKPITQEKVYQLFDQWLS